MFHGVVPQHLIAIRDSAFYGEEMVPVKAGLNDDYGHGL